ncbi:type II toxin-antitoxin system VapC family toxin [Acidianus ambivalens]|uniref:PIN domain-containing protein n=1 Tax=Acidianus ambivalens TaxID=2283 RepID=A0A650CXJ7_ACIAM|nr:type II toxin-antitoxin system VapC family toxin [Acidianus ambivalens]MQL54731.1 PIN domain-containing protein [Acidianus ambivalens]QGR22526.1 PIN domain-containing protein [Acidianus ambivalens]
MKKKILFDTGFFHVYFAGLNEEARKVMEEVYEGKSVGYTLDLNLAEFLYTYGRLKGIEEANARLSLILNSPIKIVSTNKELALRAGELKIKYQGLSIVDCFIVAFAEKENAIIYTTDSGIGKVYKNTKLVISG